jgi:intracellular multiplication protein IcmL
MIEDALETVRLRHNFYRDNYRKVLLALLFMILLVMGEAITIYWQITNRPSPKYFATGADGRITPLYALDQPNLATQAVLQWANTAAVSCYTYNFVNYREALQNSSKYFTSNGWSQFMNAVESSNNLDAVKAKKLVVSAVAAGAPIILQQGVISGRFAWKVQLPLLVSYLSASQQIQQSLLVTMLISRIPTLNNPEGIGIDQFVAQSS